jgi:hypothetical protein
MDVHNDCIGRSHIKDGCERNTSEGTYFVKLMSHMGDSRSHNNEKVENSVSEWLRVRDPD